jgi:curved DNA-binding protein CbpA
MAQTLYEVLGVKSTASRAEIRTAFRKLVLQHHPDRSKEEISKAIFMNARAAYDVLNDPEAKYRYDEKLKFEAKRSREAATRKVQAERKAQEEARIKAEKRATPSGGSVAEEILRLQKLYGRGRHNEAENLAHAILQIDPRQAIPYAVLADIQRARGFINEASKMYAYAAQMDPRNPVYQRRYEALLYNSRIVQDRRGDKLQSEDKKVLAPMVGGAFTLMAAGFIAIVPGMPFFGEKIAFVSTWSAGLLVCQFLIGVAIGSALSVGNLLDRIEAVTSPTSGRAGPTLVLGIVAMVNFWVAAILYLLLALGLRAFNYSTTRLMGGVATGVLILTIACIPKHIIEPMQTLVWGGNLIYVGGLVGWMAADALRP